MSAPSQLPTDPADGAKRAKPHRPVWLRLVNYTAGLLAVTVLAVSVGGFVVVKWFDGSIARVHLSLGTNRPADPPAGSENWLLAGTDSRAGSDGEFGSVDGQRSDTTILAHLDADGTTTMVSFPRDLLVTIPAYTDSTGKKFPRHRDKFTNAILEGGPTLLVWTIQELTGIAIDHYVSVDLEGFKKISQAVNGVNVCIKPAPASADEDGGLITNINDGYSGFHGKYGEQKVAGDSAVAFVRQRHGLPGGDIARIQRQQQFLGSAFRAATTTGVLFNPVAIANLLTALRDALTLDQGTSLTDLEKLAVRLRGVGTDQLLFDTIPQRDLAYTDTDLGQVFKDDAGIPEIIPTGQDKSVGNVQILEQAPFEALIARLKDQTPVPASSGTAASPAAKAARVTVPPSQVLVTVEDGVGRTGLADQVTTDFTREGYRAGAPGPADRTGYSTSVVLYAPGNEDSAQTVAAAVPGSVLKADPSATGGIVLIVGANFTSVQPVSISAEITPIAATPTPTASAPPVAPPVSAASASNRCTY